MDDDDLHLPPDAPSAVMAIAAGILIGLTVWAGWVLVQNLIAASSP